MFEDSPEMRLGCPHCGGTGDEWTMGICGGEGWTGQKCATCKGFGETSFGLMRIVEIDIYWDGPKLFIAKNQLDQLFLALWVGETENAYQWYYAQISSETHKDLKDNKKDLRTAFIESPILWHLNTPFGEDSIPNEEDKAFLVDAIDLDLLPMAGEFWSRSKEVKISDGNRKEVFGQA